MIKFSIQNVRNMKNKRNQNKTESNISENAHKVLISSPRIPQLPLPAPDFFGGPRISVNVPLFKRK
jgi:hypothetical protein